MSEQRLSDDDAATVVRRAAELQLEAAEGVARRTRDTLPSARLEEGVELGDLVSAAAEVGIAREYITVALAELAERLPANRRWTPEDERAARRWLGTSTRSLTVTRVIDAPPDEVLPRVARVFEGPDFGLRFRRSVGGPPLEGGLLEFEMQPLAQMMRATGRYTPLAYRMEQVDLRVVRVRLHALERGRTELVLFGDLRDGARVNLKAARVTHLVAGVVGTGLGLISAAVAGAMVVLLVTGPLAMAALVAGSVTGYRALYRHALDRTRGELERLLDAVAGEIDREAIFGANAPGPGPREVETDQGSRGPEHAARRGAREGPRSRMRL